MEGLHKSRHPVRQTRVRAEAGVVNRGKNMGYWDIDRAPASPI